MKEACMRHRESDGRELVVVARPDGLDVVHGRHRYHMFAVSPDGARALMWLLIKWRVRVSWFGLRDWWHRRKVVRRLRAMELTGGRQA